MFVGKQGPGEHKRNTTLNRTHCNSSHELEEVSKTFRTAALTADTITAARTSQATRLPIQAVAEIDRSRHRQKCFQHSINVVQKQSPTNAAGLCPADFFFNSPRLSRWLRPTPYSDAGISRQGRTKDPEIDPPSGQSGGASSHGGQMPDQAVWEFSHFDATGMKEGGRKSARQQPVGRALPALNSFRRFNV